MEFQSSQLVPIKGSVTGLFSPSHHQGVDRPVEGEGVSPVSRGVKTMGYGTIILGISGILGEPVRRGGHGKGW